MRIASVPVLSLQGVGIRPIARTDCDNWYTYLSLPEVFEHTSWNLTSSKDLEPVFDLYESDVETSPCRLAVIDQKTNALIGTVGFHTISDVNRSAEIAYDFAPAYWGKGIASVVCEEVTNWAFHAYDFYRIQATVLVSNQRSENLLKKCGYQYEGLLRGYRMIRGTPGDFKMYARLKND